MSSRVARTIHPTCDTPINTTHIMFKQTTTKSYGLDCDIQFNRGEPQEVDIS